MAELFNLSLYSDANLKGYWRLNGNSTASVGGINGSDTSISYIGGKYAEGALFNGSSSKIVVADNNAWSIPTTGKLSIAFWAKGTSLKGNNTACMKGTDTGNQYEYRVNFCNSAGQAGFEIWDLTGNQRYNTTTSSDFIKAGQWYHVVVTVDNSIAWANTNAKIYINGSDASATYAGSSSYTLSNGTAALELGRRSDSINVFFDGELDDFSAWDDVLTLAEIKALYADGGLLHNDFI